MVSTNCPECGHKAHTSNGCNEYLEEHNQYCQCKFQSCEVAPTSDKDVAIRLDIQCPLSRKDFVIECLSSCLHDLANIIGISSGIKSHVIDELVSQPPDEAKIKLTVMIPTQDCFVAEKASEGPHFALYKYVKQLEDEANRQLSKILAEREAAVRKETAREIFGKLDIIKRNAGLGEQYIFWISQYDSVKAKYLPKPPTEEGK
jgi:hypothetical protein